MKLVKKKLNPYYHKIYYKFAPIGIFYIRLSRRPYCNRSNILDRKFQTYYYNFEEIVNKLSILNKLVMNFVLL